MKKNETVEFLFVLLQEAAEQDLMFLVTILITISVIMSNNDDPRVYLLILFSLLTLLQ